VREPDLARLLLEAHRSIAGEWVANMEERGYPNARAGHAIVALIIDRRSGTRLTELAARARMTKQGMMLLVDDLEARGFVRRVADPEDARAKIVRLTTRGRTYVAESRRALQAVEGMARRGLGDRRYEQVRASLEWLAGEEEDEEE
jgi:DNA-binding MarR family transcriptional regulator